MALVLTPALPGPWVAGQSERPCGSAMRAPVRPFQAPTALAWWAGAGAIVATVAMPLNEVFRISVGAYGGFAEANPAGGVVALIATVAFLPLHMRHVAHGLRGIRPASDRWTLCLMTVIILAAFPAVGLPWTAALSSLAISVLVLLRPPVSIAAAVAFVAVPVAIGIAAGTLLSGLYFAVVVSFRTSAVFVLVWLVGAVRRVEATRRALAVQAVEQERLRIDVELNRSLGATLQEIIAVGEQLAPMVAHDPAAAREGLSTLVGRSRRTLADTRRLVTSYRHASLRAELDTVLSLLRAAHITPRLVVPDDGLPATMDPAERRRLYDTVGELLHTEEARSCVLTVRVEAGAARISLDSVDLEAGAGTP